MTVLIDSSCLVAFAFSRDKNHLAASRLLLSLRQERRIVTASVLTELFYVTMVRVNYARAVQMFAYVRTAFEIEALAEADMLRMQQIVTTLPAKAGSFPEHARRNRPRYALAAPSGPG